MNRVVARFEPRDFVALRDAVDHLLDETMQPTWAALARRPRFNNSEEWRLPLDAYSTAEEIVLQAAVPGVNPETVEITFEGDVLTIRGEFPARLENAEYLMRERRHGRFSRSITFTTPINAEGIEATFEQGVLTITAPKAETVKPKTIKVNAK